MENHYSIDKYKLDEACAEQVEYIEEATYESAMARMKVEKAKAVLEQSRAAAEIEVRMEPAKFQIAKTTEATVKAAVVKHPNVILAESELLEARGAMLKWDAAVQTLEHRKKSIESLVYLQGQGYYSNPNRSAN